MTYRRCVIVAALLATTRLVVAAEGFPALPPTFSVHDRDRDGFLDRTEFEQLRTDCRAARANRGRGACALTFEALDGNHDGRIDEQEVLTAVQRPGGGPDVRGRVGGCR
jgi:hypothetical protein